MLQRTLGLFLFVLFKATSCSWLVFVELCLFLVIVTFVFNLFSLIDLVVEIVAVTLARRLHGSKNGQYKEKGNTKERDSLVTSMQMEVRALFGRIVWHDDITNNFLN